MNGTGAKALARGLVKLTQSRLQHLDISKNNLGQMNGAGIKALAPVLAQLPLQYLDASANFIIEWWSYKKDAPITDPNEIKEKLINLINKEI